MNLEQIKDALVRTKQQLTYASAAYDKSIQVKKAFMREKESKIREAKEALRAHERAKWQAKVADTLEQFEVAGVDQTHDEMITRINEETAKNEARMEMALDSFDTEAMRLQADAENIRASELVKQFKLEMGMTSDEGAGKPELELPEDELEPGEKTLGKQKTQTE